MIAKLQVIIDDYYLDGSIINSSILTHGLFLRELTDYSRIIRELLDRENTFIQEGHFASRKFIMIIYHNEHYQLIVFAFS